MLSMCLPRIVVSERAGESEKDMVDAIHLHLCANMCLDVFCEWVRAFTEPFYDMANFEITLIYVFYGWKWGFYTSTNRLYMLYLYIYMTIVRKCVWVSWKLHSRDFSVLYNTWYITIDGFLIETTKNYICFVWLKSISLIAKIKISLCQYLVSLTA